MKKSRFIFHYFLLNKYSYSFAIICIFAVNWLQVEIPRYIKLAIDLLNDATVAAQESLVINVQLVIALSVMMVFIRILSRMYSLNPGRITEATLKNDLLHRLNRLPESFHRKFTSGKLISIINNDLSGIRLFYGIGFLQLFNIIFALSLTPIWMWRISPSLTLYSVVPILLSFFIFRIGFKRLRALHTERMKRLQNLSEQLMNFLSGIDLIKSQQMDKWVTEEIEVVNKKLFDCTMQISRIQTFILPVMDYANHFMKVIILALGGYYLLNQNLTIGEITAFLSYSVLLALPLMHLGRIVTVFQMGMVSIDSVQSILNVLPSESDQIRLTEEEVQSLHSASLTVKNLNFSYKDAVTGNEYDVLNDVSFTIKPGQKVGLLGSIGSGKSTLVNCINHHLDVPAGSIYWGDRDISTISRLDWRRFVRTVTQEPYLFSDTIIENVKFGSSKLSNEQLLTEQNPKEQSEGNIKLQSEEIEHVLSLSQLLDDISRFGDGVNTIVGEKGIMLSGGQKQRLSIARALLKHSDLIIMDNVLSAVDYETERKILAGMLNRVKDQSVLIVSHRISAFENLDEIIVLSEGKVIAKGTHEELLNSSDYYRDTWELQQHETEGAA